MTEQRPYKIIRRIGRIVFYSGHVYQCKSYHKAKQMFATLAGKQNLRRRRYYWELPITLEKNCD